MALVTGQHPLMARLAETLGLKPERTLGFTLSCSVGDVMRLTVEQLCDEGQVEQVTMVFADAKLQPIPMAAPIDSAATTEG